MKKWIRLLAAAMILMLASGVFLSFSANAEEAENKRDWNALMRFPYEQELSAYNELNAFNKLKAPYLMAWMDTEDCGPFTAIAVDFKADYLPTLTYCSLASFKLDYSALSAKYSKVETNYNSGYTGFQCRNDPAQRNGILSFWDVVCSDVSGNQTVLHPELVEPKGETAERFDWEGAGVMYRPDYPWKAGSWYRLLIQCAKSTETGNTTMEYWVRDLETKIWTKLCVYDLGLPNLTFKGSTAVFLENYNYTTAGEVRTMEFKNYRVNTKASGWVNIESGTFQASPDPDFTGSYNFGSDGECFWMISSGVPGLAQQSPAHLRITNSESGQPF